VQYQAGTSWCRPISAEAIEPEVADVVGDATVDHQVGHDRADVRRVTASRRLLGRGSARSGAVRRGPHGIRGQAEADSH
jgi:hypothetical protein